MSQNQRLKICVDDDQLQVKMGQGFNKEVFSLRQTNDGLVKDTDAVNRERKEYKDKLTEVTR